MIASVGARGFTVAIDGPAASGKGTIARALAAHFGFAHLDTGLLYRAVGARVLAEGGAGATERNGATGGAIDAERARVAAITLSEADLNASDLRSASVAEAASQVAALPDVRRALFDFQRSFATRPGGAVLDGRDIGSVICPEAEVKFFVTASDRVRADRRLAELADPALTLDAVMADLHRRDVRDAQRSTAPLTRAADAVLIDTTELSIDAAVAYAVTEVERRINENKG